MLFTQRFPSAETAAAVQLSATRLPKTNIIPSRGPLLPHYVQASSQAPPLVSRAPGQRPERDVLPIAVRVYALPAIKDNNCSGASVCGRPFPVPTGLAGHSRVAENRWNGAAEQKQEQMVALEYTFMHMPGERKRQTDRQEISAFV